MAGRRSRAERVASWRARYWARLRDSRGDLDRLAAAVDHLRTALSRCATPEQQRVVVTAMTAELVARAEALLTDYEKGRR